MVLFSMSSSIFLVRQKIIQSVFSLNIFTIFYDEKSDLNKKQTLYQKVILYNECTLQVIVKSYLIIYFKRLQYLQLSILGLLIFEKFQEVKIHTFSLVSGFSNSCRSVPFLHIFCFPSLDLSLLTLISSYREQEQTIRVSVSKSK